MSSGQITLRRFTGQALDEFIPDIARLRIQVFRDFPYLYDGTPEYERKYLRTYSDCDEAVVVVAFDGSEVVGASTGIPLRHETEAFKAPFQRAGLGVDEWFYCAESVLDARYRGQGIGVGFFREREAHARELGGFSLSCFCSVIRPGDHPLRSPGYVPLDTFWRRRGYESRPDLVAELGWKDIGQPHETVKPLSFWIKSLL